MIRFFQIADANHGVEQPHERLPFGFGIPTLPPLISEWRVSEKSEIRNPKSEI